MKVSELIERLKKEPQNLEVYINGDPDFYFDEEEPDENGEKEIVSIRTF